MTFTSLKFLLFLPAVILLYNIVPKKIRVLYLLAVSAFFYALMQPVYLLLLAFVTLTTYVITRWMKSTEDDDKKERQMRLGIVLVLIPLLFFKYYNFVNQSIIDLMGLIGIIVDIPKMKWMLPVGISYYTFMAIGYIVDVYNEEVEVEDNIGKVALFLSFFPYILSGPIERAGNIFPQLKQLDNSKAEDLVAGFKLMIWGYFMKLCVADRLCIYVNAVFHNFEHHNGTSLAFASLLYPFQLYADLGGYSLLAIGVARCLGIRVIPNFRQPFFAKSMSELWQRWHMSFINWLTDYIYTPVNFMLRRWHVWGIVATMMITFFVSGIWHYASWASIVWGLVQGTYLSIEALLNKQRINFENKYSLNNKLWYSALCMVFVYVLFAISQVYGLSGSVSNAHIVFAKIFTTSGKLFMDIPTFAHAIPSLFILVIKDFKDEFGWRIWNFKTMFGKCLVYSFLIAYILLFGVLDSSNFIYFQF